MNKNKLITITLSSFIVTITILLLMYDYLHSDLTPPDYQRNKEMRLDLIEKRDRQFIASVLSDDQPDVKDRQKALNDLSSCLSRNRTHTQKAYEQNIGQKIADLTTYDQLLDDWRKVEESQSENYSKAYLDAYYRLLEDKFEVGRWAAVFDIKQGEAIFERYMKDLDSLGYEKPTTPHSKAYCYMILIDRLRSQKRYQEAIPYVEKMQAVADDSEELYRYSYPVYLKFEIEMSYLTQIEKKTGSDAFIQCATDMDAVCESLNMENDPYASTFLLNYAHALWVNTGDAKATNYLKKSLNNQPFHRVYFNEQRQAMAYALLADIWIRQKKDKEAYHILDLLEKSYQGKHPYVDRILKNKQLNIAF